MRYRRPLAAVALTALLLATAGCSGDILGVMPEAASEEAGKIDELTYLVIWLTGITLVGVQVALVWFLFRYRAKPGGRAKHTHGNHTVEMIWTIAPAAILVFLALYQFGLWGDLKGDPPEDAGEPVKVQIFARQFEWMFRYPGADGNFGTKDDILTSKELVVPLGRPVSATMRSLDVLHSFYIPNFRVKWDALPGSDVKLWFHPTKLSADRTHTNGEPMLTRDGKRVQYWDIVCAELCGNLHTTMGAKMFVVSEADYEKWLAGETVESAPAAQFPYYADDEKSIWFYWSRQDKKRAVPAPAKWHREPFGEDVTGESDDDGEDDDDGL